MLDSKRYLHFLGAVCVAEFCSHYGIRHPAIRDFISHQIEILRCKDLMEWSDIGSHLTVSGLGDPIPDDVTKGIPSNVREDFARLVNYSAEIGMVDFFAADTDQPSKFLMECFSVLLKHDLVAPKGGVEIGVSFWGEPLEAESFQRTIAPFRSVIAEYILS